MNFIKPLEEDFERIAREKLPFSDFKNKNILVTGATGLIGSLTVKFLLYINGKFNLNLSVLAMVRNTVKAENIFSDVLPDGNLNFLICELNGNHIAVDGNIDYIIHAAAVTSSKLMVSDPVGTIKTSVFGTESILNLAVEKKVKSMVYLSSMEYYGTVNIDGKTKETALGYIDLSSVRSSYPESKRMCECLCKAYSAQYNVNVMSVRLAQTFGAGVSITDNRVFAQFAKSAMSGKDIILHTDGQSEGNYVYTSDAVSALLYVLLKGEKGEAYNVANEDSHTTVLEMAELVKNTIANGKTEVIIDIPDNLSDYGYAQKTKLFMDTGKIQKLGWTPQIGLDEAYRRMVDYYCCLNLSV